MFVSSSAVLFAKLCPALCMPQDIVKKAKYFKHSSCIVNTYSMKQSDLYYFETIKLKSQRHKPSQILYGEYEQQASILCEL